MTCNNKCIHYPVCELKKEDFANIDECDYYAEERPQGERAKTIEECMDIVPFRIDDSEYSNGFNDCSKKVLDRLKAMKGGAE